MISLSFSPVLDLAFHESYFTRHNVVEFTCAVWIVGTKVLTVTAVATLAITNVFCRDVSGFFSNSDNVPNILPEISEESIIAIKTLFTVVIFGSNCRIA